MNADEFIRKVRKLGRRNRVPVRIDRSAKSGGHVYLIFGDKRTQVPLHGARRELRPGLLAKMLKDLGLRKEEL